MNIARLLKWRDEINALRGELARLSARADELSGERDAATAEERRRADDLAQAETRIDGLNGRVVQLQGELDAAMIHQRNLAADLGSRDQLAGDLSTRIEGLNQRVVQLQGELNAALIHQTNLAADLGFRDAALAEREAGIRRMEGETAAGIGARDTLIARLQNDLAAAQMETDRLRAALRLDASARNAEEIETCRGLASRCIFVVGFARSSTTITQQALNTAPRMLMLGEANLYLPKTAEPRFSDWYNRMHAEFDVAPQKSAYAPDFCAGHSHHWWEWLREASAHYDFLGEKIAMNAAHFSELEAYNPGRSGPDAFASFFEARFYNARYIFLLRNPLDTILSAVKLLNREGERALLRECDAWLQFVMLWARLMPMFPNMLTLIADEIGPGTAARLEAFTTLTLPGAEILFQETQRQSHRLPKTCPGVAAIADDLAALFVEIRQTVDAVDMAKGFADPEDMRRKYGADHTAHPLGGLFGLAGVWDHAKRLRMRVRELLAESETKAEARSVNERV